MTVACYVARSLARHRLNRTLGGDMAAANAARLLGLMAMPQKASTRTVDLSSALGPLFYT